MNNQNSGQRVTRMERHISSPREGRRGCDGGAGGADAMALVRCGEEKEDRGW